MIIMNKLQVNKFYFFVFIVFLSFQTFSNARVVDTIEALESKSFGDEDAKIKIIEFASLTCGRLLSTVPAPQPEPTHPPWGQGSLEPHTADEGRSS